MHRVGIVIPAAGRGRRFGAAHPKQFFRLNGQPILLKTLRIFHGIRAIKEIVVVAPAKYLKDVERLIRSSRLNKVTRIVAGGWERQHSVWNGLTSFTRPPDIVLVHDAVRPLVTRVIIEEVIRQSARHKAAAAGVRVKDTVKVEGRKGFYTKTLDRSRLWVVQTPQGFRFATLMNAHLMARKSRFLGTDEASLVERLGIPVKIVEGSIRNIKITAKEDVPLAKWLSRMR